MTLHAQSLIAELDLTLSKVSSTKQSAILRCVTDLFLNGAPTFSNEHIAVFGDVIDRLLDTIDRAALLELSTRLAPIGNAPVKVIGRLSRNDDIAIAAPVLGTSEVLSDEMLVEIAKIKGQYYLSAIAGRAHMSEAITDVLIDRGNSDIARKVARNLGASLSELGFVKLIKRSDGDGELAAAIASRKDLPHELRPFLKSVPA